MKSASSEAKSSAAGRRSPGETRWARAVSVALCLAAGCAGDPAEEQGPSAGASVVTVATDAAGSSAASSPASSSSALSPGEATQNTPSSAGASSSAIAAESGGAPSESAGGASEASDPVASGSAQADGETQSTGSTPEAAADANAGAGGGPGETGGGGAQNDQQAGAGGAPMMGMEADADSGQGGAANPEGGGEVSDDGPAPGQELPLVYTVEDTGTDCTVPALPDYGALPEITALPDPFERSTGERITTRADWRCRRAEIKAELERYGAGDKPSKPSVLEASLDGNTLQITVGEGGNTFTISAPIARPNGAASGPIPAIIGINTPTGSLPASVFSSRGIATITFNSDQLAPGLFASGSNRSSGNFYQLYPGSSAGYMIRWAWGVSRIIDALEMLPEANIDVSRLAVSGCSYQGKIALYSGAFDERIALTIPHESGGGGTISWRYSHMLEERDNTEVENLMHAQGAPWYAEALMQFTNTPEKLPYDHHELMAMVAPRALLAIESTAIARMGAEAARLDALAAREVWTALGVPFRLGASEENVNHCSWHDGFTPDLEAYVDKYLLGEDVDTDILRSRYTIDTATWMPWETPTLE